MDKIIRNFDTTNSRHVLWLRNVHNMAKNLAEANLELLCNENPWGAKLRPIDIAELQFVLDAKYTEAVFDGKAFIPDK